MGEVYRARDLRLGREVAIKVLPAGAASSPDRLSPFEREARTVAGLNHPNIVTLFSVENADGIRFLTMELVDGQPLSTLITPGGLPLSRLLEIAVPMADALVAAHERGVVHRDLRPGNVMVSREGRVKVLDFGLAKMGAGPVLDSVATVTVTAGATRLDEGKAVETAPYMAPEQIRGEQVDARADIFSLGIILYELIAGRRPFSGATPADVRSAILRDAPEDIARVRADLPSEMVRIVDRCLEKDRRERFQTALDVYNELRRIKQAHEQGERRASAGPESRGVASIAVLPFANRSASEEDEYFSEGLADELLNVLAKIRGLRVAARSSAFSFKGKQATIVEIGRALNVSTLLEGSVRKAGNHVRISVDLVKVSDGYHLWSETYDRTLEDIFAVQDDIAHSVVKELRTTLLGEDADSKASGEVEAEVARAATGRASDPEAQRLFFLARYLIERYTREATAKAVEHLNEAVTLDSDFALAWAELSRAHALGADRGWTSVEDGYRRAREAARRAHSLEPDLPEAHAAIAWIHLTYDWDWRRAQASVSRAVELAPGNTMALRAASWLAMCMGRVEEAIGFQRRALERDPLSAAAHGNLGIVLHAADRFTEADAAYRHGLELAPQSSCMHALLSLTLVAQSRGEEALAEAMREPHEGYRLWALAIVHDALGHGMESDATLRELAEKHAVDAAIQIAQVHGARGEIDAAFEWLERAYEQRDGGITEMRPNPRFRSLHGDARWAALLKRMGLEG